MDLKIINDTGQCSDTQVFIDGKKQENLTDICFINNIDEVKLCLTYEISQFSKIEIDTVDIEVDVNNDNQ